MHRVDMIRRRLVQASLGLPVLALQGCTAPRGPLADATSSPAGHALLVESAAAHGVAALSGIADINLSYAGKWRPVMDKLQPALVDAGYRGQSEERMVLRERVVAQSFTGPKGHKYVTRHSVQNGPGDVRVWFNGEESQDRDARAAAALVVDGYGLFLLGPMLLATQWDADRSLIMDLSGVEHIKLDGRGHECDVLRVRMTPGLGFSTVEQLALYIDREDHLMRRVRFSLNGLESTRGAIAEVDTFDHVTLHGVKWPTRFHEQLLRPLPLPVHDWRLTGLDVNRGIGVAEVSGREFVGKALAPAATLAN